jgi:hypothetical protein
MGLDRHTLVMVKWGQFRHTSLLGQLGRLIHFHCRYCGGQFSKEAR